SHRRATPPSTHRAMSPALCRMGRPSSPKHRDFTRIAIDAHQHAVGNALRRLAGPDDAGYAIFARDDRRMRKKAAIVGDDATQERQQDVEASGVRSVMS